MKLADIRLVTAYTRDTIYEDAAHDLVRSALDHGIEQADAVRYESRGSWARNCNVKAEIVYASAMESDSPLLWVDADAEFVAPPDHLLSVEAEFAVRMRDGALAQSCGPFMSGTIYVQPTGRSRRLLLAWMDEARAAPNEWDQRTLFRVWDRMHRRPSSACLPVAYCRKFDEDDPTGDRPVIVHSMFSRRKGESSRRGTRLDR